MSETMDKVKIIRSIQMICAEIIGSFFLAMLIAASKITLEADSAPFAVGFGLFGLIYTFAPISGAHLNPAVTTAFLLSGNFRIIDSLYYFAAQYLGVMVAALTTWGIYGNNWNDVGYPTIHDKDKRVESFVAEILQSCILILVILNVAKAEALTNNNFYGTAVAFIVTAGALVVGGVSGACFNPAVALLTALHGDRDDLWVLVAGPMIGSVLGTTIFRCCKKDFFPYSVMPKLIQEFVGTFFLAWTIALTVNTSSIDSGLFAVGCVMAALVYAGGHISGGHYNPAVTLAVYLRGLMDPPHLISALDSALYVLAQLGGAFGGGAVAAYVEGGLDNIVFPAINLQAHTRLAALFVEMIFTWMLTLVFLNTCTNRMLSKNQYFGIAIGFALAAGAIVVDDISGGFMNPAIGVALPVLTGRQYSNIWVYVIGELMGGVLGAITFFCLSPSTANQVLNFPAYKPVEAKIVYEYRESLLSDEKQGSFDVQ